VVCALACFAAAVAVAQEAEAPAALSARGADTCLSCHASMPERPVLGIFQTRHALGTDPDSRFAQLQCESCHGPGGAHTQRVRRGQSRGPIRNFGPESATPVSEQNEVCLGCHESDPGPAWHGGVHAFEDLSCASCHQVHAERDPVLSVTEQPAVCFDCHQRQHTASLMAWTHPIRYGQMSCSACHDPHGVTGGTTLNRMTVNDTCYACHAEKRGPFLWEHAPVADDCTLCHDPHGSMHPAMLTRRPPLLCQQCHSQAGHPSIANTSPALPPGGASPLLLGSSCLNCHTQVHGSNHPSGAGLAR
jgi:DmsE family decaheme c-type cytochrome